MLFLAFYTSGHLINVTLMDSVHWLFNLAHDLRGEFRNHSFLFANLQLKAYF